MVDQKDVEIQLTEERDVLFPGFEEALLGHKKGETVEFTLAVPEEIKSEKFAGKQCDFVVNITETKEEILPELDEDLREGRRRGLRVRGRAAAADPRRHREGGASSSATTATTTRS